MQFESFRREQPRINMSALIDVVFILLIFVVLAANFDRIREMSISLPTAEQALEASPDALVLTVPADGAMTLGEEIVEFESLPRALANKSEQFDVLVLVGDGAVDLDRIVKVFDEAAAAGFESVSIAAREAR